MSTSGQQIAGTFSCAPTPQAQLFWPALLFAAVVFGGYICLDFSGYWTGGACVLLLIIGCSVTRRSAIVPREHLVEERALLFDRIVLMKRTKPLAEFVEIICDLMYADDNSFWVGLKHKTGYVLWVRGCGSERRFAEELAWRIHCDTGIKLNGERN